MNALLSLPIEARMALAWCAGVIAGAIVNWAVYALAYDFRPISPWSRQLQLPGQKLPPRHWSDRVPILGWLGLSREASWHGPGFWLRPLAVELGLGIAWAALLWWEVDQGNILPLLRVGALAGCIPAADFSLALHATWLAHAVLAAFMLAASLIDIDERTIPDGVTIPGTLVGLALAAIYPWTRLPGDLAAVAPGDLWLDFLKLTSPLPVDWPAWLHGSRSASLALALGCYLAWCFILLPRPWRMRRGWKIGAAILARRMTQGLCGGWGAWRPMVWLIAGGCGGIVLLWRHGGNEWIALVSALVGMIVGGGIVWLVRQIGSFALRQEAMGLGDVTLMAMIGAYLGWQPCLLVFFIAPLLALAHALWQLVRHGKHDLFYGPFLCLAAAITVVQWRALWDWAWPIFRLGWLVPAAMTVALALMAIMLSALRWLRGG